MNLENESELEDMSSNNDEGQDKKLVEEENQLGYPNELHIRLDSEKRDLTVWKIDNKGKM